MVHDLKSILNEGGLMIVESPTKAKEITKFLPSNGTWKVVPTIGFMFELTPTKQIKEKDKEHYGKYSVRVDDLSFDRLLTHDRQNSKQYTEIKRLVKSGAYKHFYVSTDPDEAGELIGAEVVDSLASDLKKAGMDIRRASWHEITKKAVEQGLANWGAIDRNKADSAEARQVYDRLFGFSVSQYLWKTKAGKSGGRAQSPCLRLIVDREKERMSFVKAEYCSVHAYGDVTHGGMNLTLKSYGGRTIATGASFGSDGKLKPVRNGSEPLILDSKAAEGVIDSLTGKTHVVTRVDRKPTTRRPLPPYTTSTFQQDVGNRLGLGSKQVMQIAQKLFEAGCITYLRSDSVSLSEEAVTEARSIAQLLYGSSMIPKTPRVFKNKKNVQEGHEAIRPATQEDGSFLDPVKDKAKLNGIVARGAEVYELVWKRTIASQMIDATGTVTTVTVESQGTSKATTGVFTAAGTEYDELGWMRVYGKVQSDNTSDVMPRVEQDEHVGMRDWSVKTHTTTPPARYTEPQLVAQLEDLGIGRPSTYASIVTVNQERGYVVKKGKVLVPTWAGFKVAQLLEAKTPDFVSYDYTSNMESKLDEIADGSLKKNDFLKEAWAGTDGVDAKVNGLTVDWDEVNQLSTVSLPSGYQVRVNNAGAWLEDPSSDVDEHGYRAGAKLDDEFPMDDNALQGEQCAELLRDAVRMSGTITRTLGAIPSGPYEGWVVTVRDGKYGPYAQAVKMSKNGTPVKTVKPVNQSLPEGAGIESITLDDVVPLFTEVKLPRTLDSHFFVGIGKRGPWIGWKKTSKSKRAQFMSLPEQYDPRTVTLATVKKVWVAAHE